MLDFIRIAGSCQVNLLKTGQGCLEPVSANLGLKVGQIIIFLSYTNVFYCFVLCIWWSLKLKTGGKTIYRKPHRKDTKLKFKVALFTHKILNGSTNISTIFHRTLTRASEIHTHNTRFASKVNFQRPKQITAIGLLLSLLFHLNLGKLFQQEILKDCRTLPSSINISIPVKHSIFCVTCI